MKKLLSLTLSLLLLLGLCACNDKKTTSPKKEPAPTASVAEEVTPTEDEVVDDSSEDEAPTEEYYDDNATGGDSTGGDTDSSEDSEETEEKEPSIIDSLQGGVNLSCIDSGGNVKNSKNYIYDEKYYKLIADAGFTNIRFPVGFASLVVSEGPEYLLDTEALRYIDIAINHALNNGLIIVLDNHHNSGYTTPEKFKRIWEQLAIRYQFYPEELMFELVNEPVSTNISDGDLNKLQVETIEIIRETNPTRVIAMAPNEWNGTWKLWTVQVPDKKVNGEIVFDKNGQPLKDENIIISAHIYSPMDFSHQGMNGAATVHWRDDMYDAISGSIEVCADYQERTGRKVWISEWGCYQGNHADVEKCMPNYYKHFTSECAKYDLPYSVWEFNVGFGIFDKSTNEFKDYLIDNMIVKW